MAKILIIEHDAALCQALGTSLRAWRHEVLVALDGEAGLEAAQEKPDLIIGNLSMSVNGGGELFSALKGDRRLAEIPYILFSGVAGREMLKRSLRTCGQCLAAKALQPDVPPDAPQPSRENEADEPAPAFPHANDCQGVPEVVVHLPGRAEPRESTARSAKPALPVTPRFPQRRGATPASSAPETVFLAVEGDRRHFVKLSEVKALLADSEYSRVFWGKNQQMMFRKSLKQWESELSSLPFVRVHRNAIINLSFLDFVEDTHAGGPRIHLKEFTPVLAVSQRRVSAFNGALRSFGQVG